MKILALETSSERASLALLLGDAVFERLLPLLQLESAVGQEIAS